MIAALKKQSTIKPDKTENGVSEPIEDKLVKQPAARQAEKATKPAEERPRFGKPGLRTGPKVQTEEKAPERPALRSVRTIDDKAKEKSVTIVDKKSEKNGTAKANITVNDKVNNNKTSTLSSKDKPTTKVVNDKPAAKTATEKTALKPVEKTEPASKPILKKVEKTEPTKPVEKKEVKDRAAKTEKAELPPRKPSLQKTLSKDILDGPVKKWRDPLHERVKENIDKTLANEMPKGHTLTKNESLRSLLKPTPPPMPPPLPPKMPPPPEFKKAPVDPEKLKKLESLRSRPRRRPDWSDMMKEVEEGKKLKKVVCNDRSQPIITKSTLVKNKDQFIFESEKPNSKHNELLNQINKGIKLKKTKTNDRSKPNLEGLRKFRRQMTIEEQVQKSMSQANLAASPSGVALNESQIPAPTAEEEEIDEMDDIDHVRDDLQSTKQLLAIELRNKDAQERENKRLLTRIANLEAEVARERAIIKQEQHKTVISVTDAYDERLVTNLKMEVEKAKETADNLEKQYLQAAEERDTAITELEEAKRKNAELEKKLEQALANNIEEMYISDEPLSFYQKRQIDLEKQCRLLNIDMNSPEAEKLWKTASDANNNAYNAAYTNNADYEGIMPTNVGSRRSSHAIKSQLSVTKDDSFEEEEESEEEEEEISPCYINSKLFYRDEKKKYKELKREVDKMAAMMKEVGSDEEDEDEEEEEEEEEKKSESEEEETETETEQDTESETESESEAEDAPLPNKKDNLTTRLKRHESRVNALKKGNALLMANVDRLKDDVLKQREESCSLKKELDSLIDDLD
ncbi:Sarcomere length short [Operophtera brumata]|uniref:Sarcomere length short n=1 Tax=Operophtera brumata TaxID=104452 RepID=A0A0L7LQ07_OPEBR|nr:Sarcomere length short [Operophtera brumata]